MRTNRLSYLSLLLLNLFLAFSTIAGGLGILLRWIPLPLDWLRGSPFADYTIPGLALLLIVGGLSATATLTVWGKRPLGPLMSAAAGGAMMIYEIVEYGVIGWHWLQALYFLTGLLIAALAARIWIEEQTSRAMAPVNR